MSTATQPNPLAEGLHDYRVADPSIMVIFGAAGDLSSKKLLPAIYNLVKQRLLPAGFAVMGAAIDDMSDDAFRKHASDVISQHSRTQPIDQTVLNAFMGEAFYQKVDFGKQDDFKALQRRLDELDASRHTGGNRIYYCATPPPTYETIIEQLKAAAMTTGPGFHRIVVEKPFGSDLKSARELNKIVQRVFHEDSVYRIDHYLGKETVQNILAFRFGNGIFEPLWNRTAIDHVQITVAEDIGIGHRAGYYDRAGALRDVIQNHALQLLSLVAMEPPASFDADLVRDEKAKALHAVRPLDPRLDAARGQYTAGWVAGERVPGYREEEDVPPDSHAETYAALRVEVDNWRWAGVPFYLRTGKRLPLRTTEIAIAFRPAPHLPFRGLEAPPAPNELVISVQPNEGATLQIAAKVPGTALRMRPVQMDFQYGTSFLRESPEAYERLLHDALLGDATLFTRADEVEAAWQIVDPVLRAWEAEDDAPESYEAGTSGPHSAEQLLAQDGRAWRAL
jgi:glucose-6-phosphate 1-dehydrogenase